MSEGDGKIAVTRLCAKFGKSPVAFYKSRTARKRLENKEDFILLLARRERMVNPMAGCKKVLFAIRPAMASEGVSMGVNRFYRLMKKNGMLVPKRKKYTCVTTRQDKSLVPSPNLVKGMVIDRPDQALCSDITYVYTEEGFLFLSLVMDMFVHDIVGWAVRDSLKAEGPLAALEMAGRTLRPDARPVAHSDRGCQYGSHEYREALERLGWLSSMTEELHCYENAMAERLNGILKHEYFLDTRFKTKKEAIRAIEEAVRIYNTRRLHEKCGYKTPAAFRAEWLRKEGGVAAQGGGMRAAARDSAPCRTGRGLAASRRPFGDARSPVRHGAGAEPPPCHQAIQSKKEVLTFNRDLTGCPVL